MRLLVSVRNADEAEAALAGGADIIDAKEPAGGALGAVSLSTFHAIVSAVAGARPVTAALGDGSGVGAFAASGAAFVKVGLAGLAAALRAANDAGVVAVYAADADSEVPFDAALDFAATNGAKGLLVDTADKSGPGLLRLLTPATLARYVALVHARGLFIALAGKLSGEDLPIVRRTGADIAGVRGAACVGTRMDSISTTSVQRLVDLAERQTQGLYLISSHAR